MLNLTKWIADYYYAPWGETIKSSLPAGINAEAETILSITSEGRAAIPGAGGKRVNSAKMEALARIAENGMLDAGALAKELNKNRASAVARELERAGYITVTPDSMGPGQAEAAAGRAFGPARAHRRRQAAQRTAGALIKTLFDSGSPWLSPS